MVAITGGRGQARQLATPMTTWPPPFFERMIYYILVPDLFARVVLETGLNMYPPSLTQPKQWVFFLLVLMEYLFISPTIGQRRFRINMSNLVVMLLFTMAVHGLIVGLVWSNKPAKIFTDSVPVIVTAVNVLLLNTENAFVGFNFKRLSRNVFIYSIVMVIVGALAVAAHRNSVASLGGAESTPICLTIILVHLATKPMITVLDLLFVALILGPTVPSSNRTSLALFFVVFTVFIVPKILKSGKQLYFSVLFFAAAAAAFVLFVPSDSMVMKRINGLTEHVTSEKDETSGSLYERQAEWEAIKAQLAHLGPSAQFFGYGAGGIYRVQFSGGIIPENYSHAHYSWSLFRLRYGYVGFVYLSIYATLLVLNLLFHVRRRSALSRTIAVLDIWCLLFLFTYVFFNFLAAGLQFSDSSEFETQDR